MLPFALSIFVGAFLLFAVQPIVGKYILPWFGGGPGVWTTCLLFFQVALLAGYAYAHALSPRLAPRRQAVVHMVVLAAAVLMLPIVPGVQWKPLGGEEPVARILLLLTACVGLPYFALSATGPLLQHWFSCARPGQSPYRLYALSNLGSLLALVSYPLVIEPLFSRSQQARSWSVALVAFALACGWAAWTTARVPARAVAAAAHTRPEEVPSPFDRFLWFAFPAIASVLLLATTNKLCQDVAVVPFLWVLPLALYLLSFILCFDHPRWYSRGFWSGLFALGALVDVYLLYVGHEARLPQQIVGYTVTLFAGCMVCHGELFALRPAATRLTGYYLSIATGGAVGSFLVAIVAPLVLDRYVELQIGLWLLSYFIAVASFRHRDRALAFGTAAGALAATFVIPALQQLAVRANVDAPTYGSKLLAFYREQWAFIAFVVLAFAAGVIGRRGLLREWQLRVGNFLMLFSVGLGILLIVQIRHDTGEAITTTRDFYGVLKVFDHERETPELHYYSLVHGVTSHGLQFVESPQCTWPTTYYTETSGVGRAIDYFHRDPRHPPRHIGLVGLGTGTVAAYGQAGDTVRIYEIDPQVQRLALTRFRYVTQSAAKVDIVLGDARLSMERELRENHPQQFDVLALDAFSSDAIPVHLLTAEAFETYLGHMSANGIIAVHTSNRYLDLQPVVEALARRFKLKYVVVSDSPPAKRWWAFRSTWILLTRNQAFLDTSSIQEINAMYEPSRRTAPLWTDDHASIYPVLRLR